MPYNYFELTIWKIYEFILIQYFAVRYEQGSYKGVVEVSQEISEIRNIQGEQRLLDWTS